MDEIKLYRLTTGETVIGRDDGKTIKDAYMVRVIPKSQTEVQTVMSPFFAPLSDKKVDIDMEKLLVTSIIANDEISQKYIQVTSGLIIPRSNHLPPNLTRANLK